MQLVDINLEYNESRGAAKQLDPLKLGNQQ